MQTKRRSKVLDDRRLTSFWCDAQDRRTVNMSSKLERYRLVGLVAILGAYYLMLGLEIGGITGLIGIAGGVLILLALPLRTRSRPLASALLLIGATPVAVMLWWSVVVPVLALLTLVLGGVMLRRMPTKPRLMAP
jgi:hypothetical protein